MIIVNTFGTYNDYAVYKYLGKRFNIIDLDLTEVELITL